VVNITRECTHSRSWGQGQGHRSKRRYTSLTKYAHSRVISFRLKDLILNKYCEIYTEKFFCVFRSFHLSVLSAVFSSVINYIPSFGYARSSKKDTRILSRLVKLRISPKNIRGFIRAHLCNTSCTAYCTAPYDLRQMSSKTNGR